MSFPRKRGASSFQSFGSSSYGAGDKYNKRQRAYYNNKERFSVAARQAWRCAGGGSMLTEAMELDHRIPHALVGEHEAYQNLQLLCPECHSLKTVYDRQWIGILRNAPRCPAECKLCNSCGHVVHVMHMGQHKKQCRGRNSWAPGAFHLAPASMSIVADSCRATAKREREAARRELLAIAEEESAFAQ